MAFRPASTVTQADRAAAESLLKAQTTSRSARILLQATTVVILPPKDRGRPKSTPFPEISRRYCRPRRSAGSRLRRASTAATSANGSPVSSKQWRAPPPEEPKPPPNNPPRVDRALPPPPPNPRPP